MGGFIYRYLHIHSPKRLRVVGRSVAQTVLAKHGADNSVFWLDGEKVSQPHRWRALKHVFYSCVCNKDQCGCLAPHFATN